VTAGIGTRGPIRGIAANPAFSKWQTSASLHFDPVSRVGVLAIRVAASIRDTIDPAIDALASPVITGIGAIAATIQFAIRAIAGTVHSFCRSFMTGRLGAIRPAIESIVDSIPFIVESLLDSVTAPVEASFLSVAGIGERGVHAGENAQ
jgi:phage-related protein